MFEFITDAEVVAIIGLFGGVLLGLAARFGRFCTLGAIEDQAYGGTTTRLKMWGTSIGFSVILSFGLLAGGVFDPMDTFYLGLAWNPIASIIGGVMFGYGMALCGNCGYGALSRLGGGDLRAFMIVIVMGISAFVVMSGPLAGLRVWLFPTHLATAPETTGFAALLSGLTGAGISTVGIIIGIVISVMTLATGGFWREKNAVFWSLMVAIAISSGWLGTSYVAQHGFDPIAVESHTFAAPVGDTILYAMNGSALSVTFGIGSVVGVLLGAFIGSLIKGHFRWEACEDPRELRRQIIGAAIMGVGAVLALGCSVGQGITAFSVLAFSAPVTFVAIYIGARIGLRQLIEGFAPID
jgi:uncharacterized membrane protein YedE/YeeE